MILYLGTSSIAKLYVQEPGSDMLRIWTREAEIVATSRIAYTEMMSALDRRRKAHDLSPGDYDRIAKRFSSDWAHFVKVDFDDFEAGKMVRKYGLKRFGAIHLSAAKLLREEARRVIPALRTVYHEQKDIALFFSSGDRALCSAASSEGLIILPLT